MIEILLTRNSSPLSELIRCLNSQYVEKRVARQFYSASDGIVYCHTAILSTSYNGKVNLLAVSTLKTDGFTNGMGGILVETEVGSIGIAAVQKQSGPSTDARGYGE